MSSLHSPQTKSIYRTGVLSPSRGVQFLHNCERHDGIRQKALSFTIDPPSSFQSTLRNPIHVQTQTLPSQTQTRNFQSGHTKAIQAEKFQNKKMYSKQKKQSSTNTYFLQSKKINNFQPLQTFNEKRHCPSGKFEKNYFKDRILNFESLRSTIKIHPNPTEPPHSTPATLQSNPNPKTSLFHNFNESKRFLNKQNNLIRPSHFAKIQTTASSVNSSFQAKNKLKSQKASHCCDCLSSQKISHLQHLKENVPSFFPLKSRDENSRRQRKLPSFLTSKVERKQFEKEDRIRYLPNQKMETSLKRQEIRQQETLMSLPIKKLFNKKHVKSHSVFENFCGGERNEFKLNEPLNNCNQSGKIKYQLDNCPTQRRQKSNSIHQDQVNLDQVLNFRRKNIPKVQQRTSIPKELLVFRESLDRFNFKGLTIDQNSHMNHKNEDFVKMSSTQGKKVSFEQWYPNKTDEFFVKKIQRSITQKSQNKPTEIVEKTHNLETIDDIKQALIGCNLFSEEDYNGVFENHKKDILKHSNSTAAAQNYEQKIQPSKLKPSIRNLVDPDSSEEQSSSESTEEEKKLAQLASKSQQKRSKWILEQTDIIKQSLKELSEFNTEKSLHQNEWKKISTNDLSKQKRCSVQIDKITQINEDQPSILESRDFKLSSAFMLSESECAQLAHRESDVIQFQKRKSYEEQMKLRQANGELFSNVCIFDFNMKWLADGSILTGMNENQINYMLYIAIHKLTKCIYLIKKYDKVTLRHLGASFVSNFIQGIRIQMKLFNHPNIQKIYAVFTDENHFYVLCQYTSTKLSKILSQSEHQPLFKSLEQSIYLDSVSRECQRVQLFKDVIDGLEEIHLHNIIHKNFQPNSIRMVWGTCKISSFEMCQIASKPSSSKISHSYVCPESLFDNTKTAMDIWCLGILAYEILIGKKPFQSDDKNNSTAKKILQCNFDIPAEKASLCEEVLNMALKRNPKDRASIFDIKNTWESKLKIFSSFFNQHKAIQHKLMSIIQN